MNLGILATGFHRIEFLGANYIDDDRCLERLADAAWLAISRESRVEWNGSKASAVAPSVADWLAETTTSPKPVPMPMPMVLRQEFSAELGELALNLGFSLSRLGLQPVHAALISGDTYALEFAVMHEREPSPWPPLAEALAGHPEASAALHREGKILRLLAKDEDSFRALVSVLASGNAQLFCDTQLCFIAHRQLTPSADTSSSHNEDPPEWTLANNGHPRGWTARGVGEHTLRLAWLRPPWWRVLPSPTLKIRARLGAKHMLATGQSSLSVTVNGVPIATYDLDRWPNSETIEASVRIPESLWNDPQWELEFRAHLRSHEKERCSQADDSLPWFLLEPTTTLEVPHRQSQPSGFSRYFADHVGKIVSFIPSETLDAGELNLIAALALPLGSPGMPPQLHLAEATTGCSAPCLRGDIAPGEDALHLRTGHDAADLHWVDPRGTLDLPMIPATDSAMVELFESGNETQISYQCTGHLSTLPPLPYEAFRTEVALFHRDEWVALSSSSDDSRLPVGPGPVLEAQGPQISSEEDSSRSLINILWMALCALVIALTAWRWTRVSTPETRREHDLESKL